MLYEILVVIRQEQEKRARAGEFSAKKEKRKEGSSKNGEGAQEGKNQTNDMFLRPKCTGTCEVPGHKLEQDESGSELRNWSRAGGTGRGS